MGGVVIPPGLVFGLKLLSADGWGQTFPKWTPPDEHMQMNICRWIFPRAFPPKSFPHKNICRWIFPRAFLPKSFPHKKPHATAVFPGDPPRTAVKSDPDLMEPLFCPGTQHTQKPVSTFQEWSLHFLQSHGAPMYKSHWPSMPDAPGVLSPNARSPVMGLRTLTLRMILCDTVTFQSWASHPSGMGLLISHNHTSYLLMWPALCLLE